VTRPALDKTSRLAPAPAAASVACAVAILVAGAGVASAQTEHGTEPGDVQTAATGGGTVAPGEPAVSDAICVLKCIKARKGVIGTRFRITGSDLHNIQVVSLPRSDGKRAKDTNPIVKPSGAVLAYVNKGAITGDVRIADSFGQVVDSPVEFKIGTLEQLKKAQSGWRFPIRGPHTYGDGLGADRGDHKHQGQDVMAACKTKLVVARGGKVQYRGYQAGGAGNYIVIDGFKSKHDFVYMHLLRPALAAKGQTVATGQMIGKIGSTGSSSACHLHFEMWGPPGWYEGGHFINPTPHLKYWDTFS
jgi:murein DD-endopeptidase MepM/ murein hydrolase activator NlpD